MKTKIKLLLLTVTSFLTITGVSQTVTGSGTQYYYPMWGAGSSTIGDGSIMQDAFGNVGMASSLTVTTDITNLFGKYKLGTKDVIWGTYDNVYGNMRVLGNTSANYQDGMYINYSSAGGTGAHLRFYANGATERMRIDASTGNVGIGTTTPGAKLEVAGSIKTSSLAGTGTRMVVTDASGNLGVQAIPSGADNMGNCSAGSNVLLNGHSISSNGTGGISFDGSGNTTVGGVNNTLTVNGNLAVSGTSTLAGYVLSSGFWTSSDKRYKRNIKTIESPLQKVMKIKGVTYEYNREEFPKLNFREGTTIGFIAQELEKIFPEAVMIKSDGYYVVNYQTIVPVLVEAIKEQQQIIDNSKTETVNQINSLQQQINNLVNYNGTHNNVGVNNTANTNVNLSDKNVVVLEQNVPNPFAEQTVINYNLPDNFARAQIIFLDQSGKPIKTVDLTEKGKGTLNVFASDLTNGVYTYSLIVDGQTMETKKMVRTK